MPPQLIMQMLRRPPAPPSDLERRQRERVVNVALDEIGRCSGPRYNPTTDYNADWWCGIFVMWVLNRAGLVEFDTDPRPCERMCKSELPMTLHPRAGDVLWMPRLGHFAIVTRVERGVAYTIDGNHRDIPVQYTEWPAATAQFHSIAPLLRDRESN